jgi:hypothetical protein
MDRELWNVVYEVLVEGGSKVGRYGHFLYDLVTEDFDSAKEKWGMLPSVISEKLNLAVGTEVRIIACDKLKTAAVMYATSIAADEESNTSSEQI